MRKWVAVLFFIVTAWPVRAASTISIDQMEQLLATLQDKPDAKVAEELKKVQLTERVSLARLTRWESAYPGNSATEELVKLADMSAFLKPPEADIVANPAPDIEAQKRILLLGLHYVTTTTSQLPNLFAARLTTHFETTPSQDLSYSSQSRAKMGKLTTGSTAQDLWPTLTADPRALQSKDKYSRRVTYRDGHEVFEKNAGTRKKGDESEGLTTSGEFGPILETVLGDAMHGSFRWLRWEKGSSGPVAEFSYAVPQVESHYRVGITDQGTTGGVVNAGWRSHRGGETRQGEIKEDEIREFHPAYHGVIGIEPTTGAILRLSLLLDMTSSRSMEAAIAVEYAPVTMGDRSYICAARGVAFLKIYLSTLTQRQSMTPLAALPVQLKLNDVVFTDYHRFGSSMRLVADMNSNGSANTGNPEVAPVATSLVTTPSGSPVPTTETAARPVPGSSPAQAAMPPTISTSATPATGAEAASSAHPPVFSTPQEPVAVSADTTADAPINKLVNASASGMVLHVKSRLVLVDVVVTEHNKPVHGLDRSLFHIVQDGHEQALASFEEFQTGATTAGATLLQLPELPPNTYSNVPVLPNSSAANVILLDALNTQTTDQMHVRQEMVRSLKALPSGRPVAIFTLGSKLRLLQGFTSDTGKILTALADKSTVASASLLPPADQKAAEQAELDKIDDALGPGSILDNLQNFMSKTDTAQTGMRVELTLEAFQELARYLSGIPGRKNLVWFSGAFPLQFYAKAASPIEQMKSGAEGSFDEKVRTTADLLAAARVAVYPVDARGVLGQSMFSAANQPQNYSRSGNYSRSEAKSHAAGFAIAGSLGGGQNRFAEDTAMGQLQTGAEHASMDLLAQDTGGRAVYDSNGLQEAFENALSDGSNYYTLSYVPEEGNASKSGSAFHHIEVRVNGGKYQLAYRRAYYTDPAIEPANSAGAMPTVMTQATVLGAPPSTQILFQARVLPAGNPELRDSASDGSPAAYGTANLKGKAHRYAVDLNVNPAGLTITQSTDGVYRAQIECALVAYDAQDKVANTLSRTLTFRFSPEQYQHLQAAGGTIPVRLALSLPPGRVALRIVVYDPASASTGSLEVPVLVARK